MGGLKTINMRMINSVLLLAAVLPSVCAYTPASSVGVFRLAVPRTCAPHVVSRVAMRMPWEPESVDGSEVPESKIDGKGLAQLISMGLGTMTGDIKEINWDD